MSDILLAGRLRRNGIKIPLRTIDEARRTKCPLADACAMLMMETGGGRNIYGHDPVRNPIKSPPGGSLSVTETNFRVYRHYRVLGYGMQGVGVAQLTWYSFQDQADAYGGCWKVEPQLRVALEHLTGLIRRYGEWGAFRAYNGTGAAATAYANTATAYARHFRWVIGGAKFAQLAAFGDAEAGKVAPGAPELTRDKMYPPLGIDGEPLPAEATSGH
jgi:hypothetical protein